MPFSRHNKAVLQFSGGKDSLACLFMMKEHWDKIYVVWVNTGAVYPEVIEQMESIRAMVPNFIEARSDSLRFVEENGIPSDIVAVSDTEIGRATSGYDGVLVQPWSDCCSQNIWMPLLRATQETGAKLIIRGQRADDVMQAPVRSGDVIDGLEYYFPLQDMTEADVFQYLKDSDIKAPDYYSFSDTSLDCWHCTAFLNERKRELRYMRENLPDAWEVVGNNIRLIYESVSRQIVDYEDVLGLNEG